MDAIVYRGPNDLRLDEIPVPRISATEMLVQVAACGVCPTDLKKIQYGTVPPPRIFGHETAGTIVRVGARVRGFRPGERVALHHHVPCLECSQCRHQAYAQCAQYKRTGITAGFEPAGGGFAEYVRVMPFVFPGIVKIPARNSFLEGAMVEPVNTVLKAVKRLKLLRGDCVLVAGQGPIGLMFTRLLALRGIKVIATDLIPERLRFAEMYGAHATVLANAADLADQIRLCTRKRGLDAAVICVPSNRAVSQATELLRPAGQLLLFAHTKRGDAITLDPSRICVDEVDVIGSYSADITIQEEVARLIFSRKLDVRPLITHQFPLAETPAAVRLASNPSPEALKIVIMPQLSYQIRSRL